MFPALVNASLTESRIIWEVRLWACIRGIALISLVDVGEDPNGEEDHALAGILTCSTEKMLSSNTYSLLCP